jgi:hypothetical protein
MTLDLANITKADVYAAAQDLAQRLERQITINDALRLDLSRSHQNCIGCEIIWPARMADFEAHLETACELLNQVDVDTVGLTYGSIVSFIRDRRELNAARRPTEAANGLA